MWESRQKKATLRARNKKRGRNAHEESERGWQRWAAGGGGGALPTPATNRTKPTTHRNTIYIHTKIYLSLWLARCFGSWPYLLLLLLLLFLMQGFFWWGGRGRQSINTKGGATTISAKGPAAGEKGAWLCASDSNAGFGAQTSGKPDTISGSPANYFRLIIWSN